MMLDQLDKTTAMTTAVMTTATQAQAQAAAATKVTSATRMISSTKIFLLIITTIIPRARRCTLTCTFVPTLKKFLGA
jgi:hypothetical protein